jgi:choline dehydrogenase-like flavoprotein
MIFPEGSTRKTSVKAASEASYDVVIVGSGISGSIIARQLGESGKRVLILEAGPADDHTISSYENYLQHFYGAAEKDNQSPYPDNPNASMPRSPRLKKIAEGATDDSNYIVQRGPFATDSVYTRVLGGTTMHWEAKTPRFLPEDFEMQSQFARGVDWPLDYDALEPYYRIAEREFGVSGDVEEQKALGIRFPEDYVFPMYKMPHSYLDQKVDEGLRGMQVELDGRQYDVRIRSFPQGRNGIPNPAYDGGRGFRPEGAVSTHQVDAGERCQGNNNCVPLCPVQAKYHAGRTLAKALNTGNVDVLAQAVASKVMVDPGTGRVSGIEIKHYHEPGSPEHETATISGKLFVLGANAVENARLMLASGLQSSSGLVGKNFMDHAYLLCWGLMPQICGTMRGTNVTGGVMDLRGGSFRRNQAAFAMDIHNDGWGWAVGSPMSDLNQFVDQYNKFGTDLRRALIDRVSRQLLLAFMVEVLPEESNCVAVDPAYTDPLGNMRPIIKYSVPEYTMKGIAYAREFSKLMFERLGVEDFTHYDPADYGYVRYQGEGYSVRGGNHLAGTHIMGTSRESSVVNAEQQSWDHPNLYLVGGGSMPSIGTANITPTIAALCYRSAKHMIAQLN